MRDRLHIICVTCATVSISVCIGFSGTSSLTNENTSARQYLHQWEQTQVPELSILYGMNIYQAVSLLRYQATKSVKAEKPLEKYSAAAPLFGVLLETPSLVTNVTFRFHEPVRLGEIVEPIAEMFQVKLMRTAFGPIFFDTSLHIQVSIKADGVTYLHSSIESGGAVESGEEPAAGTD